MVRRWAAILLVLCLVRVAGATFYTSEDSVGSRVAVSDCVVLAKVGSVEKVASPDPRVVSPFAWWKVTLEVHETLRGPVTKDLVFFDHLSTEPAYAPKRTEQMFFLESGAREAGTGSGLADVYKCIEWTPAWGGPIDTDGLSPDGRRLLTDDLRALYTKDELLKEVRRVVGQLGGSREHIMVFFGEAVQERLGLEHLWLEVAITDDCCAAARDWIVATDPETRWCGAEVLCCRRSAENAEALRRFAWTMTMSNETRYYGNHSRARLLAVLRGWRVPNLPPLVQASPSDSGLTSCLSLAGLLLLPTMYVCWKRRRTWLMGLIWTLAVGAVAALVVRSYGPQDAVTWGDYDLALEQGWVYLVHHKRADVGLPSPLVFCRAKDLIACQGLEYAVPASFGGLSEFGELSAWPWGNSFAEHMRWPFGLSIPWTSRLCGPIWAVPGWALLAIALAPGVYVVSRNGWRRWLARKRQGFPVVFHRADGN